jgi:NADH-quinone oxidoreductase subunit C
MTATEIADILKAAVPGLQCEAGEATDQPTLVLTREQIVEACQALRDEGALRFALLAEVTAVDWWPAEPRFEVVYHLVSIEHRQRLRVKIRVGGGDARVPTVTGLWPGANWPEREVWDLFGIVFEGHPDLRRVLMPEDWDGHPLRKDYPVQVKLPVKVYEPLQMTAEEFRKSIQSDRASRGSEHDVRS